MVMTLGVRIGSENHKSIEDPSLKQPSSVSKQSKQENLQKPTHQNSYQQTPKKNGKGGLSDSSQKVVKNLEAKFNKLSSNGSGLAHISRKIFVPHKHFAPDTKVNFLSLSKELTQLNQEKINTLKEELGSHLRHLESNKEELRNLLERSRQVPSKDLEMDIVVSKMFISNLEPLYAGVLEQLIKLSEGKDKNSKKERKLLEKELSLVKSLIQKGEKRTNEEWLKPLGVGLNLKKEPDLLTLPKSHLFPEKEKPLPSPQEYWKSLEKEAIEASLKELKEVYEKNLSDLKTKYLDDQNTLLQERKGLLFQLRSKQEELKKNQKLKNLRNSIARYDKEIELHEEMLSKTKTKLKIKERRYAFLEGRIRGTEKRGFSIGWMLFKRCTILFFKSLFCCYSTKSDEESDGIPNKSLWRRAIDFELKSFQARKNPKILAIKEEITTLETEIKLEETETNKLTEERNKLLKPLHQLQDKLTGYDKEGKFSENYKGPIGECRQKEETLKRDFEDKEYDLTEALKYREFFARLS